MNKITNNYFNLHSTYFSSHFSKILTILQTKTMAIAVVILTACSFCYVAFSYLKSKKIKKDSIKIQKTNQKTEKIKQKVLDKAKEVSTSKTTKTNKVECRIIDGVAHVGKFLKDELVEGKIYFDADQTKLRYEGCFKNGRLHGENGKIFNQTGLVYEGTFDRGYIVKGSMYAFNMKLFTGEFQDFNCVKGTNFLNGEKFYEGDYAGCFPVLHGKGIRYNPDKTIESIGQFVINQFVRGSRNLPGGIREKGTYANNQLISGEFSTPEGRTFEVKLVEGKPIIKEKIKKK